MSRMVSRGRMARAAAALLGVLVLGVVASTAVLDPMVHTPDTGGPVVESLSIAAAAIPATTVGVLLAARRPRNPIGWLLFAILIVGASPRRRGTATIPRSPRSSSWRSARCPAAWPWRC